jgi:hypothetical protein
MSSTVPPTPSPGPDDIPDLEAIIVDDGAPAPSIFISMQRQLLVGALYDSWGGPGGGRTFQANGNVGLFNTPTEPPLVPDCMLSLDVPVGGNLHAPENRAYFRWVKGQAPEVAIEIVADVAGWDGNLKQRAYARVGVVFFVVFDPDNLLGRGVLRAFALTRGRYVPVESSWFEEVGLGLTLWTGSYARAKSVWLRWCDAKGQVIPTATERFEDIKRAERLAAQLRALGIDPDA